MRGNYSYYFDKKFSSYSLIPTTIIFSYWIHPVAIFFLPSSPKASSSVPAHYCQNPYRCNFPIYNDYFFYFLSIIIVLHLLLFFFYYYSYIIFVQIFPSLHSGRSASFLASSDDRYACAVRVRKIPPPIRQDAGHGGVGACADGAAGAVHGSLAAGALTGGPVTVGGVEPAHLAAAIELLRKMGCTVTVDDAKKTIRVARHKPLRAVDFATAPFPGFPTDLQAPFMLLAACADGTSTIEENVFESRFMFAAELMRMGADIQIEERCASVAGVPMLEGAPVSSTDLRAGAALVLAGLVAEGETCVLGVEHIDRGYEDYVGKLRHLGADVSRVTITR